MQLNYRLPYPEINIEQQAADMASRIMERVRQKSNVPSAQKILIKSDYFRSSDYKPRQSDLQSNRLGTTSVTERNDINSQYSAKPNQLNQLPIQQNDNIKTPQKSQYKTPSQGFQDLYSKTVKLNNNYYMGEPQIATDKADSTKLIKLMDSVNNIVNNKQEQQIKHRKIDSITHSKSILGGKTNLLQTPTKYNKDDIVSQLLGSLKNSKKYSDYKNSAQK